jgi:hypothetical protein
METGYKGAGWDHYDPNLAPIYWPIEEATWLRCVTDGKALELEILYFVEWLEDKLGFNTDIEILKDLVFFQVFILSTMDRKELVKMHLSKFSWKDFLLKNSRSLDELQLGPVNYYWNNKVTLDDKAEWCYKAIWVGRNQGNYKCHPEFLQVAEESLIGATLALNL